MSSVKLLVILLAFIGLSTASTAQSLDETIVYVECNEEGSNKPPRRGSGVMVSADGKVLTAKHVVVGAVKQDESRTICKGVIGNAFLSKQRMFVVQESSKFDAALLQYPVQGNQQLKFLKYCRLTARFRRQTIFATGFPMQTNTGVPSSRVGVLSTALPGPTGVIETDSSATTGMSGGMVTLGNTSSLIGIVAGAITDPATGLADFLGVLPAEKIATEFELVEDTEGCLRKERVTGEFGQAQQWRAGDPPLSLGVHKDQGFCFITSVWGVFNHADDSVSVTLDANGEFQLTGVNEGVGRHGAYARCFRF